MQRRVGDRFNRGRLQAVPPVASVSFPSGISNLQLRLLGGAGITDAGGGAVSQWNDQSGNGRNFVQGTASNRPTTSTAINGKATVTFDGSNDNMTCTATLDNIINNNAASIIAVVMYTGVAVEAGSSFNNPTVLRDSGSFFGLHWCAGKAIAYNWDGSDDSARPAATDSVAHFVVMQHDTNVTCKVDGGATSTTASGNTSTLTGTLNLGGSPAWAGAIGELLVYDRVLSAGEIAQINAYTLAYWGV